MTKKTSPGVGSLAASVLSDPNASKIQKQLAGSALSQTGTSKDAGTAMESKAAKVLDSSKYSDVTKTLAGSVLSQSKK